MKLPKVYEPAQYEADIYALWEKGDAFKPQNRGGDGYFSMTLPPPNANANLHIGYGLTVAVHDILARYHRMQGRAVLIVPGADHAGFETWAVYEKKLNKEGKSRFDFSREDLYKQVYRGERIVNYCTFHGTSFADIEVVHKEEQGKLWHIRYPIIGGGEITVATTRPETMLGDSGVAVNPTDKRYSDLVGKKVKLPLVDREIPIVADEMVDVKFGSGAVKITPAHDPADFDVSERHNLTRISVIGNDGKITNEAPEKYRGLNAKEARKKVIEDLKHEGALVDEQDYTHSVGHCYKCDTIIEPLLQEQWFVRMEPLAKNAIKTLADKQIKFHPDGKRLQLIRYLEGLKDWNISRQIVWGIPIPAFQNVDDASDWIFDTSIHKETIEVDGKKYKRDPDTLDTWFSSSSWPYATLDYPDGEDFNQFYPLSLMDTGGEILYPWVSRMVMLGLYATENIPFKEVYIHGYVMSEDGAKMSKSLGNTVDLSETIAKYGSDALRMGIIAGRVPAVNRPYDSRRLEEARNFSNKIWNIARYIEGKIGDDHNLRAEAKPQTPADHWILSRLNTTVKEYSKALENYRFSEAYEFLYHFVWHDFADWYIEASKVENNTGLLAYVLESTLKIAHPFAPFVTETIWQTLAWEKDNFLATQLWPKGINFEASEAKKFEEAKAIVSEARHIISVLNLKKPKLYYNYSDAIVEQVGLIIKLANLGGVEETKNEKNSGLRLTAAQLPVWLEVDHKTAAAYMNKLQEERQQRQQSIKNLEGRLSNKSYVEKAPETVVQQTRDQLSGEESMLKTLEQELENFKEASRHI
jgi:valyl-tRNA synthetase